MFEIKKTDSGQYRLIIYRDSIQQDSLGFLVDKKDLYDLLVELRDVFKDEQKVNLEEILDNEDDLEQE